MLVFHTHTCLLIACLYTHCVLAYSPLHIMLAYLPLHIMLAYLHLHTLTLAYFALGCFRSSSVCVCKCKCRSVSVQRIFRKNPSQCFREKEKNHKLVLSQKEREKTSAFLSACLPSSPDLLQVAASGIAGFSSACVSTPADVVKTRLMNAAGEDVKQYRGTVVRTDEAKKREREDEEKEDEERGDLVTSGDPKVEGTEFFSLFFVFHLLRLFWRFFLWFF